MQERAGVKKITAIERGMLILQYCDMGMLYDV